MEIVVVVPDQAEKTTLVSKEHSLELKKCVGQLPYSKSGHPCMVNDRFDEISLEIMEHRLHIWSTTHTMKQKRRHFDQEKEIIIREEVQKLLEVRHIVTS